MWLWRLRAASCRRTTCGWRAEDSAQAPRLPALAQVLDGHSRSWAALASGMNRRTPRDWAHRYNAASATALAAAQVHPPLGAPAPPARVRGKPLEVWFQDAARIGQKGRAGRGSGPASA